MNQSLIMKFGSKKKLNPNLLDFIHDEFIIEERTSWKTVIGGRTHWDFHLFKINIVFLERSLPTHSLRWVFVFGKITRIIISIIFLIAFTQSHITKQKNTSVVFRASPTIIRWFWTHICEVYTLAKHISSNRSFRRSNSQSLTQNTNIVRESTSMPQQHPIPNILRKSLIFPLILHLKQIH